MVQKTVYLDSSDFSVLSNPADQISGKDKNIIQHLRDCKNSGSSSFYISIIHLAEAVHAGLEHRVHALRRATLMKELCGSNILRIPSDIMKQEIHSAINDEKFNALSFQEILSKENEWFGIEFDSSTFQETRKKALKDIDNMLSGLPRHERRKWKSKLNIRKSSARDLLRNLIDSNQPVYLPLPVSLIDRDLVIDCFLGLEKSEVLQQKILELMKDPYLLFEGILDQTGHREEMFLSIRTAGRQLVENLNSVMQRLLPVVSELKALGIEVTHDDFLNPIFNNLKIERALFTAYGEEDDTKFDDAMLIQLIDRCPGFRTFCFFAKAYFRAAVEKTFSRIMRGYSIQELDPSVLADLLHFTYAPYVDIFRCDNEFGRLSKDYPSSGHVQVVSNRADFASLLSV